MIIKFDNLFTRYNESVGRFLSTAAAGARLAVAGTGDIGVFKDVLHCPDGAASILSEIKMVRRGYGIIKLLENGEPVGFLHQKLVNALL